MKYKTKTLRFFAWFLCLCMLVLSYPLATFAEEEYTKNETASETVSEDSTTVTESDSLQIGTALLGAGEKTIQELRTMRVEDADLPETISLDQAYALGHVNRLHAQENSLNSVLLQNQNGTKTAYIYSKPVKYVAADGTVRDKSSSIGTTSLAGYAYAMEDNSTKVYFSSLASGGVTLRYEDYVLTMKPQTSLLVSSASLGEDENTVLYNNAFGARTVLMYQTNLYGVKEDIVLLNNVGKYAFTFQVIAAGMTTVQLDGAWYFVNEAGETIMALGEICITDSAGKTAYGEMTVAATAQSGVYTLTIHVPQAFLQASDTVYPVYIDPTTTVNEIGYYYTYEGSEKIENPYDAIIDVGLYNNSAYYNTALANTASHTLHADYGKVIYKLYDFYGEHGIFKNLRSGQIISATLRLYHNAPSFERYTVYPMTATWTSSTTPIALQDDTLWSAYSTAKGGMLYYNSSPTSVYIFDIVRSWADYNHGTITTYNNPANGLVLASNYASNVAVSATEYSSATNNVYFELTYSDIGGEYFIKNKDACELLLYAGTDSVSLGMHTSDYSEYWHIQACSGGMYTIKSGYDMVSYLHSDASELLRDPGDEFTDEGLWYIDTAYSAGGYVFRSYWTDEVLYWNGSTMTLTSPMETTNANYSKGVWELSLVDNYVYLTSFAVSNNASLDIGSTNRSTVTTYPSNATWSDNDDLKWSSSNTAVATVDDEGYVTGVSQGYAYITAYNPLISSSSSYAIIVGEEALDDGIYYINSSQLSGDKIISVELENASTDNLTPLQQVGFHAYEYSQWEFKRQSDGYYTIKSVYSGKYVGVENNSPFTEAAILQYASDNVNGTRWAILPSSSGNYIIASKVAGRNNIVLARPTTSSVDGFDLTQLTYTNNSVYEDEWDLCLIGAVQPVELEAQVKTLWCWAATSRMFAKNYYPNITYTQEDAVIHVKGSNVNQAGSATEIIEAFRFYVSSEENEEDIPDLLAKERQIYSENILKSILDQGHVVFLCRGRYNASNSRESGHATLLIGYVFVDGNCMFLIRNPSAPGSTEWYTYERIVREQQGTDVEIWDGCIIMSNAPYVNETIPYALGQS